MKHQQQILTKPWKPCAQSMNKNLTLWPNHLPNLHQNVVNMFLIVNRATVTIPTIFELSSSHARATPIKFTKQEWVSQLVREWVSQWVTSIPNDRTRVRLEKKEKDNCCSCSLFDRYPKTCGVLCNIFALHYFWMTFNNHGWIWNVSRKPPTTFIWKQNKMSLQAMPDHLNRSFCKLQLNYNVNDSTWKDKDSACSGKINKSQSCC